MVNDLLDRIWVTGISQAGLARHVGVTPRVVRYWKNHAVMPSLANFLALEQVAAELLESRKGSSLHSEKSH